jgi:hypothetical protein
MNRRVAFQLAGSLLLVACGGRSPGQTATISATATIAPSPTPASTQTPTPSPIPSPVPTPDPAARMPGACDLLANAEIEAATGFTLIAPNPQPSGDYTSACGFSSNANGLLVLTVWVHDPATPDLLQQVSALSGTEPLSLTGASGIWVPASNAAIVIKHGRLVSMSLALALQGTAARQAMTTLAKLVADRMP